MLISIEADEADLRKFAEFWSEFPNLSSAVAKAIMDALPEPEVIFTVPLSTAKAMAAEKILHRVVNGEGFGTHYDVLVAAAQKALKQC